MKLPSLTVLGESPQPAASEPIRATGLRHVLICEPQWRSYNLPYLPAMWGVLKTYWEAHAPEPDRIVWHEPIHTMDAPDKIAAALRGRPIDVLGLSCYTWNWRLQCEVARRVRASHPECLIVAGGPQPAYRDPAFFDDHPYLDAVVVKDGEIPFTRILQRVLAFPTVRHFRTAGAPLHDIPGLCLPAAPGELTAPAQMPRDFSISHYLVQRDYYLRFMRDHPAGVVAAWETSRGCPFSCSYCDWGSNTMSSVRRFDMERLYAEIDFFARHGVKVVFSVDSNFGMFKTDVDLTDALIEAKQRHGSPQYFVYSNAKNVPGRTVEITRKVIAAGLETAHTLSIQHTSEDVLAITDRQNISLEKQVRVVRDLQRDGVPISVQLILGLPGDTPALWRKTFTDLMEWGIHDGYTVTNYHLLPNAPAAAPEYRQRWQIDTVDRYIYDGEGIRRDVPMDPLTFARGDVIVATKTFSRGDWVAMSVEADVIRAMHNAGVTQLIARYLRSTHGLTYHDFYSGLLDRFLPHHAPTRAMLDTLAQCHRRFLDDPAYLAMLPLPGSSEHSQQPATADHVEPHRWAFATIMQQRDAFFTALTAHLLDTYSGQPRLADLCAYQRAILVHPDYHAPRGKTLDTRHDWLGYFRQLDTLVASGRDAADLGVAEPQPLPTATRFHIRDTGWNDRTGSAEYTWPTPGMSPAISPATHAVPGPEAWDAWFRCIATNRLSAAKCLHQQVQRVEQIAPAGVASS